MIVHFSFTFSYLFILATLLLPNVKQKSSFFLISSFLCLIGLLTLIFIYYFNHTTYFYLLILWLMSLALSLTDMIYLTVEPIILYPLSFIYFLCYYQNHSFSFISLGTPLFLFLFFFILDYFLPNSFGGGDVKLLMVYSIFLSFIQLLYLILIASLLGIIFFFINSKLLKKEIYHLPFVPFLTVSLIFVSCVF